jgi:hypothetical protein
MSNPDLMSNLQSLIGTSCAGHDLGPHWSLALQGLKHVTMLLLHPVSGLAKVKAPCPGSFGATCIDTFENVPLIQGPPCLQEALSFHYSLCFCLGRKCPWFWNKPCGPLTHVM